MLSELEEARRVVAVALKFQLQVSIYIAEQGEYTLLDGWMHFNSISDISTPMLFDVKNTAL